MANLIRANPIDIQWYPHLPIYASPEFLKGESEEFGWIGGTNTDAELVCILPFTTIRKFGFRMVRFRTATIPLQGELALEDEKVFLNGVVEHFLSVGADLIIPSGNAAIFRTFPDRAEAAPYGTVLKVLDKPEPLLWSEIRPTHRHNIRKAAAAGVEIKSGLEYLDAAYELIVETMKRSGASFRPYEHFKKRILALGESVKIFVAEHDGVMQGCMVSPFSLHTAYDCYAGSVQKPVRGAMHLLHWEAMRQFRALGARYFDFQGLRLEAEKGSKQDGIAEYKQGFGGTLVRGHLWRYALRPVKFAAYSFAARVVMGGDVVDQERRRLSDPERVG